MNDKPDLWFPVGVHWYSHPRFLAVKRGTAYGLYWAMNAWSRDNLTDGFVPDSVIVSLLAGPVKADPVKDRAELVRVGLLYERPDGVEVHKFLGWNDSAEKVQRKRAAARKAADIRWQSGEHANGNADGMQAVSDALTKPERESKPEAKTKHDDEGSVRFAHRARKARAS